MHLWPSNYSVGLKGSSTYLATSQTNAADSHRLNQWPTLMMLAFNLAFKSGILSVVKNNPAVQPCRARSVQLALSVIRVDLTGHASTNCWLS